MTQEEKSLLLKDLCARLPYGVKCNAILKQIDGSLKSIFGTFKGYNDWATVGNNLVDIETVKPYLRPMSSITEKEISDLQKINWQFNFNKFDNFAYVGAADDGFCSVPDMEKILSYLNAHHFDYRKDDKGKTMIEKGLALRAPEGMYDKKK